MPGSISNRHKRPITVVSMDVDNFKTVNDRFGHQAGDELLCLVADTIRKRIRVVDLAARLGGDEFAVLLPETGAEAAEAVVKRLQKDLLEAAGERDWPVTFSFGVVTFYDGLDSVETVLHRADNLMYSVKQDGKNMIRQEVIDG